MNKQTIRGSGGGGGGKGGSAGRQAKEDPDSLRSKQYATVVDVLSEGEIGGLVNGLRSVFLNDTPLQNSDGTFNFQEVDYFLSNGGPSLPTVGGKPGYFESGGVRATTNVQVEATNAVSVTRTISNPEVDWVEVTIGVPRLTRQNKDNGDVSGGSVSLAIDVQAAGGGFAAQTISNRWSGDVSDQGAGIYRTVSGAATGIALFLQLHFTAAYGDRPYSFVVEYRAVGAGSWTELSNFSRSGSVTNPTLRYEAAGMAQGQYEIRLRNLGVNVPLVDRALALGGTNYDVIQGKAGSRYQRTYRIPLVGNAPWDIRVRRISPDATDSSVSDETYWDSYTECVDVKLNYAYTAAMMLNIDAENFQSIPTRGYEIYGLLVRVPSNYDPVARSYTGSWDGTFKIEWTDNPAWCFYDLLSATRYGLGDYIEQDQIDKWSLYEIGRYCDELVPDGFGGTEPRFTCNLYMQTREDAFRVIQSMASIFRGMAFWAGGQIVASQDAPKDPAGLFNAANAIEGMFTYQGADHRARHTVALVSWNDPRDMYRQKIEYVQDDSAVLRWGVVETEILAVGCTSRGQAHRAGKWLLYTEQNESETVAFKAGMDSTRVAPGDVILIQDSVRSGKRLGGRCRAGTTANSLAIDAPITIEAGMSYQASVMLSVGQVETRDLTNSAGSTSVLALSTPLTGTPVEDAIWVVTASNQVPEKWRVLAVAESDDPTIVAISAIYHDPGKYAFVEQDVALEYIPTSTIPVRPGQVTAVVAETELFQLNDGATSSRIAINWKTPATAVSFIVAWRRDDENYKTGETVSASFDIDNVVAGTYTIKITPKNAIGVAGDTVTIGHVVEASGVSPDVENLAASPSFTGRDLSLVWDAVPGAAGYELEFRDPDTDTLLRTETTSFTELIYPFAKNAQDGGPRRSIKVRARAKTLIGVSANWTQGVFTNPAPAAPQGLQGEPGPGQASIMADRPADQDLVGMIVWMHNTAGVPTIDANKVYQGSDNSFTKTDLTPGMPMYFKVAFYDAFGAVGLNVSSSIAVTPLSTGGVLSVNTLPASPAEAGGELAVFLDVADLDERGLYGWDGTGWISTSKILDGTVTTDKLAAGAVDYTKLAAGAVRAENLALKKHFLY